MDDLAKDRIAQSIAQSLGQTPMRIQQLQLTHFRKADSAPGTTWSGLSRLAPSVT